MLPSWLRQLKKRFAGHGATLPIRSGTGLRMETLEDRVVPATWFWTGGNIDLNNGQIITVLPDGSFRNNARWSNPANWSSNDAPPGNLGIPGLNDDVVFPRLPGLDGPGIGGRAANGRPPATGAGTTFNWDTNSAIDQNFQIRNLTFLDDNYRVDAFEGDSFAPAATPNLVITGEIRSRILTVVANNGGAPTGMSLLGPLGGQTNLSITVTGNPATGLQGLVADETAPGSGVAAPGVLKISAGIGEPADGSTLDTQPGPGVQQVGFNKTGPGTMILSGGNSYRGAVTVGNGALFALHSRALGDPVSGTFVSGPPGVSATLGVSQNPFTDQGAVAESITINGLGSVGLGGASGGVTTNLGALSGVTDPSFVFSAGPFFVTGFDDTGTAEFDGNINMQGDSSIGTFGSDIIVDGQISGPGNLTKIGGGGTGPNGLPAGQLTLNNKNAYSGETRITAGAVIISDNDALSSSPISRTIVSNGAALGVAGSITVNEPLFLNGNGALDLNANALGALRLVSPGAQARWTGPITLETSSSVGVVTSNSPGLLITTLFTLSGPLNSLTGVELSKVDVGILRIPVANNLLRGPTTVRNGVLQIADPLALGPAGPGAGAVTVSNAGAGAGNVQGTLQLEGTYTFAKAITLNGQGSVSDAALRVLENPAGLPSNITLTGPVSIGAATSIRVDPVSTLTVNGQISGPVISASLDKFGQGTLNLNGTNTYVGNTTIREGTVQISNARALGAINGAGTSVFSGATLRLTTPLNIAGEPLVLSGVGVGGLGALQAPAGSSTISGNVVLNGVNTTEADISVATGGVLNFSGVLSGDADLRKLGLGELQLTGAQPNQFVKTTFVDAGTLSLGKTGTTPQALGGPTGGAIVIGDGLGVGPVTNNVDVLRLLAPNQIPNVQSIIVRESGLFDLNNFSEQLGGLSAVSLRGGEISTGTNGVLTLGGNLTTAGSGEQSVINGTLNLGGVTRSFNFVATPPSRLTTSRVVAPAGEFVTFTFDADANPGFGTPSGRVTFVDKFTTPAGVLTTTVLGTVDLDVNGVGSLAVNTLATGSHEITAQYSGDLAYPPVQVILNEAQRIVNPQQQELLSTNANPAQPNTPIRFDYQVGGPVNTVRPTGTVRFFARNMTTGATSELTTGVGLALDAAGRTSLNLPQGLATGRYVVTAQYSGDAVYAPSTTTLAPALAVGVIPSVTAAATVPFTPAPGDTAFDNNVARAASPVLRNDTVRFVFRASGSAGTPTGSVTFFDTFRSVTGAVTITNLGTQNLDVLGQASIDASFATVGEHIITAEYSGDAVYTPNTATLSPSQIVTNPLAITLSSTTNPVVGSTSVGLVFRANGRPGEPLPTGRVRFFNTTPAGVRQQVAEGFLSPQTQYDGTMAAVASGSFAPPTGTILSITADFESGDDFYENERGIQTLVPAESVIAPTTPIIFRAIAVNAPGAPAVPGVPAPGGANSVRPFEPFDLIVESATAFGRVIILLNGQPVPANLIDANVANNTPPINPQPNPPVTIANGLLLNLNPLDNSFLPGVPARVRILGLPPSAAGYRFSFIFAAANGSPVPSIGGNGQVIAPLVNVIAPIGGVLQSSTNPIRENTPLRLTFTTVVKPQGVDPLRADGVFQTSATPTGTVTFRSNGAVLRDANGNQNIPLVNRVVGGVLVTQAVLDLPAGLAAVPTILTARYSGDGFYRGFDAFLDPTPNAANPPDLQEVVFGGNQVQISVTSTANSAILGSNVTFTFAAPGNINQQPATGTVQFIATDVLGGLPIPIGVPQVLAGGVASVSTALLPVGVYRVTATYSGDSNYTQTIATLTPNQRIVNPPFVSITGDAPLDPVTGGSVQSEDTPLTFTFSSRRNVLAGVTNPLATGDVEFRIAPIVNGVVLAPVFIATDDLDPSTVSPAEALVNAVASVTAPGLDPGTYVVTARYLATTTIGGVTTEDRNYQPIEVVLNPNLIIVPTGASVPDPTPDPTIKPSQQPLARIDGGITGTAVAGGAPPGVIKAGVGTLTINGTSTYTGPTVQNSMVGSSIILATSNALPNTPLVITSGTVDINGTTQRVSALVDDTAAGGSSTAGNLAFTGGGTLNVGSTAASVSTTYAGVMTGTGTVNKNGVSTLALTGPSAAFNGTINVNSGTLRVNNVSAGQPGNYSGATFVVPSPNATTGVAGGGTLGGTGTVGRVTFGDGSFAAPGATTGATGTLAVANALTLSGASTFQIDLVRGAAVGTVMGDLLTAATVAAGAVNPILSLNIAGYNTPTIGDNLVNVLTVTGGLPTDFRFRRPDGSVIEPNGTVAVNGQAFRINYGANTVTAQYAGLDVTGTLSANPAGGVDPGGSVTYTLDLPTGVGGTVTFTATGPGAVTPTTQTVPVSPANGDAVSSPITFTVPGNYTVIASYSGNATIAQKDFRLAQPVNFATTMSVSSSNGSSIAGQPVTFTAVVTSGNGTPTGTVAFTNATTGEALGTVGLVNGVATLTTTAVATGTNVVRATFVSGDGSFRNNTADVLQTVNPPASQRGAFYTNAVVVGNLLVVQGNGVPGGVAVIPVPAGTVALFTDLNGDGSGDVILILPNLVVVFDGATGRLLFLFSDSNGDGRRELLAFAPDGSSTLVN